MATKITAFECSCHSRLYRQLSEAADCEARNERKRAFIAHRRARAVERSERRKTNRAQAFNRFLAGESMASLGRAFDTCGQNIRRWIFEETLERLVEPGVNRFESEPFQHFRSGRHRPKQLRIELLTRLHQARTSP